MPTTLTDAEIAAVEPLCKQVMDTLQQKLNQMPSFYKKLNGMMSLNKHIDDINGLIQRSAEIDKRDISSYDKLLNLIDVMCSDYNLLYSKMNDTYVKRGTGTLYSSQESSLNIDPKKHHFLRMLGLSLQEAFTTLKQSPEGRKVIGRIEDVMRAQINPSIKFDQVKQPPKSSTYEAFVNIGKDPSQKEVQLEASTSKAKKP